jgi:hydroxyacylglutathione hydrolase
MPTLEIRQFPCRSDNYGVLVHDRSTGVTASIDAPDERAIREALSGAGWALTHIFTTHHHYDHVAGHEALKRETNCTIYGPGKEERDIPCIDIPIEEGERLTFGSIEVQVLQTSGHTPGGVTYFIPDAADAPGGGRRGVAFTGDTLFSVGCGRAMEGRHAEMWRSLEKIMALPPDTLIFCGHEYTQANIRFALTVDPENEALLKRKREVDALIDAGKPALPVPLARELETNPFLRVNSAAIRRSLGLGPDAPGATAFEELRRRKDRF